ncbi:lateral signaling target protein 2 homolog [Episyrphus balteatus]|uniref:lateral signaling target protein 2 homolog n=1 Tax=Episyrphus balteatus TaxID=286459 RepID=UPI002486C913|nr:lateral signaling target protein 2 homolog [Episyrphus balteatus]
MIITTTITFSDSSISSTSEGDHNHSKKRFKNPKPDYSSGDKISSLSDGDPYEVNLVLRAAGRMKTTEYLLHRSISSFADQLQTNFTSDLRQILHIVFLMDISPSWVHYRVGSLIKSTPNSSSKQYRTHSQLWRRLQRNMLFNFNTLFRIWPDQICWCVSRLFCPSTERLERK